MTKRYSLDIPRRALDLLAEGRAVKSTAPCAAIWGTVRRLTAARRWRDLTVTGSRTVPKAVPRLLRCWQFDSVPQVKEPFEFGCEPAIAGLTNVARKAKWVRHCDEPLMVSKPPNPSPNGVFM